MSGKRGRTYRGVIGIGLGLLTATALVVGAWALLAPGSFYEDFPAPGRGWVSALPPYNEHLVRDVGALNLALAALLGFAALSRQVRLARISLVVWLVYATPHFVYHVTEIGAMPFLDDAANVASLGLVVVLPLVLLFLSRRAEDATRESRSDLETAGGPRARDGSRPLRTRGKGRQA